MYALGEEMEDLNKRKARVQVLPNDQGRIQVRLWGGGEFQLVELMYILGENKNVNLVGLIYSNLSRKGCI